MGFIIFRQAKSDGKSVDEFLQDDRISRMTVIKRDGSNYGIEGTIYLIEGNDDSLEYVKKNKPDALEEIERKKADEIYKKIKEENDNAEEGMGFIFG